MGGSETILVAEDADEIRRMICGMLVLQGYNCLAAGDGVDALQIIESGAEPVHLLLTDMVMPRMMGWELARHVAERRPHMRILSMPGLSDDPLVRSFERVPAILSRSRLRGPRCARRFASRWTSLGAAYRI
jgi:CheY-like chemotaxis protein